MELVTLRPARAQPRGIAILAKGFRPMFLLAALHAVVFVPLWLLARAGGIAVHGALLPTVWHGHEMVFGFSAAVVAGFLLTAASNWTKRVTATGGWLALICGAWLVGRGAMLIGGELPPLVVAVAALSFLPLVIVAVGRVVLLARSKRNYGVVGILVGLWLAQLATHVGALTESVSLQTAGPRVAVDLVVVLVLVIGGRIIPLFTRSATKAENIRSHPWLDRLAIASGVALLLADASIATGWVVSSWALGAIAVVAAVASAARAVHWGARASLSEPLLWVLHAGYVFVPLGFALRAVALVTPQVTTASALHALTVGAVGTLTLGMMARVSLGHTGRMLKASRPLALAFAAVIFAALTRVIGPIIGGVVAAPSVTVAGVAWTVGFALFVFDVGPSLFRPRPDGKPG